MSSVERWTLTVVWNGSVGGSGNAPNAPLLLTLRSGADPKGVRSVCLQVTYSTEGVRACVGGVECDVLVLIRLDLAITVLEAELTSLYLIIHLKNTKQWLGNSSSTLNKQYNC